MNDSIPLANDSVFSVVPSDTTFSIDLPEVEITVQRPEVVVRGDTLEFNAGSYKMQPNAVIEDLLKRLPGVEVQPDGKISVAGKEVKKILVNGKEFFGDDPKLATKNIQVEIVDKVQVVDKKSDTAIRTGVEDGVKETIINLTIKPGMFKGWIGNVSAGGGAFVDNPSDESPRYAGKLMLNRFTKENQASFFFNSNNINNQGFSENMPGMSMGSGGGINNSSSAGLNINSDINEKLKIGGSASYNYSDALTKYKHFRQDLLVDSVSYNESVSESHTYSNNSNFNTHIEYKPDSLNSFYFSGTFFLNSSNSNSSSFQRTLAGDADSTLVNRSDADVRNNSGTWGLNASIIYSRKFRKQGRRFNMMGGLNQNRGDGDGSNESLSEFFLQSGKDIYLKQESENNNHTNNWNFTTSYVEPVWKAKNTLQFSYSVQYSKTSNIRETYDYDPATESYSKLNADYSRSLANNFLNQALSASFNSKEEKYSYNIGLNIIPSHTQSKSYIKDGDQHGNDSILNNIPSRNVINYSPQIRFSYRFSDYSGLNFNYSGSTRQPDISQLDPTPNNTNPLYIVTGNPDLLPSFSNNLSLTYNTYRPLSQQTFYAMADFSFVRNEIINVTKYEAETGIQHIRPINENGSWNGSLNGVYSFPLGKAKNFRVSLQTRLNYDNRVGYAMVRNQDERNISGTLGAYENLGLNYHNKWFQGQLMGTFNYNNTSNSVDEKKGSESSFYGISYNMNFILPYDWSFFTDINYGANRGLSAGYNADKVFWSAAISKQFLKRKQAGIRLAWNDILRQNLNVNRSVTANYIQDSEYNSLSSYVMLSFSYKINEMGNK